ncbi:hypothetical protein V6N13_005266 [Hibiscus sabdariffa]
MLASAMASANPVEFYKLSLQSGRSTCSNEHMRCSTPLPPSVDQRFTIHGLWLQDAMDDPIDPNTSTHSCIPKPPIDLDKECSDLKNPLVTSVNMKFWESEWKKHGTYSDFAHDPFNYFNSELQIRASLLDFGIRSGANYKVEETPLDLLVQNLKSHATLIATTRKFNSGKYASVIISQNLKDSSI